MWTIPKLVAGKNDQTKDILEKHWEKRLVESPWKNDSGNESDHPSLQLYRICSKQCPSPTNCNLKLWPSVLFSYIKGWSLIKKQLKTFLRRFNNKMSLFLFCRFVRTLPRAGRRQLHCSTLVAASAPRRPATTRTNFYYFIRNYNLCNSVAIFRQDQLVKKL